ncbi:MAG: DUF3971 domain-containing protein [Paracoccaceae bacterium]|nr:DUF3971 domain-containing protein [Paracoccaceae bacterium]
MAVEAEHKPADRRGRFGPFLLLTLGLALVAAWAALTLASGRAIVAPSWITERIEARAEAALGGAARIELGSLVAVLGEGRIPRIVLRDLAFRNAVGAEMARVPELRARFLPEALLGGKLALSRLTIVGAELTLRRDRYGRFDLAFGTEGNTLRGAGTLPEILAAIDRTFGQPGLSGLETVSGEALRLTFQDALTGRIWRAENGTLTIRQEHDRRSLSLGFVLAGGAGQAPASVRVSLSAPHGESVLDLATDLSNVTAADLATQVPALAWLTAVDAPLSANVRGRIGASGQLESFDGALEVGAGAIRPRGAARPIPIEGGKAYLAFDPAAGRIEFADITAQTPEVRFRASGQALLGQVDPASGLPGQLVIQLALSEIELNPVGELAEPARFESGAADLRLSVDPLRVELGQLTLVAGDRRFQTSGEVRALAEGWAVALDFALNTIPHDRLFALWPLRVVPKTREWLTQNVTEGLLHDVKAALRLAPDAEPRLALGYEFRDGTVRFMPTLPPIVGGAGHATIDGTRYTMVVTEGEVLSPSGEAIDTAGSVFTVPDITIKPAPAEIRLETASSIPAALSLLDQPPFEFLSKSGRGTDLAEGRARVSSVIRLPLADRVQLPEIDFTVNGKLTGVRSETLVQGRVLTSAELALAADEAGMTIAGVGRIGGAEFDAAWWQPFDPGAEGASRVEGTVVLNQSFLDEFGIALPEGSLRGEGSGQITLELPREAPPEFSLISDLNRLALSIPALGWSKGQTSTGRLEVAGQLGQPARIERLILTAPGLSAEGRIELADDGTFARAVFDRVRTGAWLDAPVELTGRGAGRAPAVSVRGGRIDLRETDLGGSGAGGGGPLTLALDRLIVSEGIEFRDFRAILATQGGLSGRFTARLAGAAPVEGVLAPTRQGTAVRLQAADAGAVLRAAGLLQSARQGELDLTLVPLPGEGHYDGRLKITNLRLRGAPVLAELLAAVSVVGLLEQLNGQGIVFGEVTGEFTLDPRGITLHRGSAVGTSLGVSMSGVYDLRTDWLDMRGTISPIYLVNSIGQIFSRRGEGLFGFNYRMRGPADDPRTTVNPLSILTPGMFREIFRAAPPRLAE